MGVRAKCARTWLHPGLNGAFDRGVPPAPADQPVGAIEARPESRTMTLRLQRTRLRRPRLAEELHSFSFADFTTTRRTWAGNRVISRTAWPDAGFVRRGTAAESSATCSAARWRTRLALGNGRGPQQTVGRDLPGGGTAENAASPSGGRHAGYERAPCRSGSDRGMSNPATKRKRRRGPASAYLLARRARRLGDGACRCAHAGLFDGDESAVPLALDPQRKAYVHLVHCASTASRAVRRRRGDVGSRADRCTWTAAAMPRCYLDLARRGPA